MFKIFSSMIRPIRFLVVFVVPILAVCGPAGFSNSLPACGVDSKSGDFCTVVLRELRPTQLAFGGIEVDSRAQKFRALSESERSKSIAEHPLPGIVGPGHTIYLTDHHHFALAAAQVLGAQGVLLGNVLHNWSNKTMEDFWNSMIQGDYVYLMDENGQGPFGVDRLKQSIFELKNDPLRSLAWGVRNAGGYDRSDVSHADFLWAQYFRPNFPAEFVTASFSEAVTAAKVSAGRREASGLPGYHP